jgi:hypothetical protein
LQEKYFHISTVLQLKLKDCCGRPLLADCYLQGILLASGRNTSDISRSSSTQ